MMYIVESKKFHQDSFILTQSIDNIPRRGLSQVQIIVSGKSETTDINWLLLEYPNIIYIENGQLFTKYPLVTEDTKQGANKFIVTYPTSYYKTGFVNYGIQCFDDKFLHLNWKALDLVSEDTNLLFIQGKNGGDYRFRSFLQNIAFFKGTFVVFLNTTEKPTQRRTSFVFNPFGDCIFSRIVFDYNTIPFKPWDILSVSSEKWAKTKERIMGI